MTTREPIIGILGLQGDVLEHAAVLDQLGVESVNVRRPSELERVDGLILPGGESTTVGMLLVSSGLDEPLRKRLAAGMPAFGTCAGMILLSSDVLDGRADQRPLAGIDITVRRNAFGRQLESFEADLAVVGLSASMHAVFIRAPIVEKWSEQVAVLASIEVDGVELPVVCQQGNVFVASFHPELAGDVRLHSLFLEATRSVVSLMP